MRCLSCRAHVLSEARTFEGRPLCEDCFEEGLGDDLCNDPDGFSFIDGEDLGIDQTSVRPYIP